MRNPFRQVRRDERGMTFVIVGLGFMAFMASTTLAIDVGMFMTARSQAQNSADAGALAGAVAMAFNDWNDRSSTGPAVTSAISAAQANTMMGVAPSVLPSDVTFPNDPAGQPTRVQVTVYRTTNRGNAIPTLIGPLFGVPTVDIGATATAEVAPANAMTCVKPFMIPDKWMENNGNTTFDLNTDVYIRAGQTGYTGYSNENDVGTSLVLRAGTGNQPNPSFYYSWKMSNDIGGDFYRENIENCNTEVLRYDADNPYYMIQEPGNKQGPTIQGIKALIDKDPSATWDSGCNCVRNSAYSGQSPRVFPIPLFNPQFYAEDVTNGRVARYELANFLGFFADYVENNGEIHGIITHITGVVDSSAGPVPIDMFAKAIRLVQ
jgi:Putative Flp pilus-assembly TadE/G-like